MISLSSVTKGFGSQTLYKDASLQLNPSEKVGLVGPNGAGKTTLFRLICGTEGTDLGQVSVPKSLRVTYFRQDVEDMSGRTVLQEVMAADERLADMAERLSALEQKLSEVTDDDEMQTTLEQYGKLQEDFEQKGGYTLEARAREILSGLGIPVEDQGRMTETFSGGWKMRIALSRVLVVQPDVLLLDEPTNHLDLESIVWLEGFLKNFPGTLLMTSHDREFMNRIVSRVVEVAHQSITSYSGNYDFYERESKLRREQLLAAKARQDEMLAKEEDFIARFKARASHAAQVQSRVKKLEKIDRIEIPPEEAAMDFRWPEPPRGGDEVVRFADLGKIWSSDDGRTKLVFSGASGLVRRLERIAVVGVNGAGKSTFLKIVSGQTDATEGSCRVGPSIAVGYFSQNSLDVLSPQKTVIDEVHDRIPNSSIAFVRNLLGAFKFSGDEVEKKVSVLSGGEKSRLLLATLLANPINFLVLDEPTNHLDIQSRQVLLESIKNFPGTVMIVSHDRYFLRQTATRVFELDKNHLQIYEGDYNYYLEKRVSLQGSRQ
jgi:ATP-binding cassette, subfamily F, member 3